jgi:hypothetical protein
MDPAVLSCQLNSQIQDGNLRPAGGVKGSRGLQPDFIFCGSEARHQTTAL